MGPFLTDADERATVKGSRDPLGIQPIWTRFGRHVVGNLTTVSNSVRDFTTLLLGFWFAERIAESGAPGEELPTFLKWEQLAAYARAHVNNEPFRGVERTRRNLAEGSKVTLSADRAHQILGDQKVYGLWGLYTVPARASGLVEADPPRLTPAAREMVERVYLPVLEAGAGRDARDIVKLLRQPSVRIDVKGRESNLVATVARVLKAHVPPKERGFYRNHLVYGGADDSTGGLQRELAALLIEPPSSDVKFVWSPLAVGQLAAIAMARGGESSALAHRLTRIRHCETLVAPASVLFWFLLARDGATVDEVATSLRGAWGPRLPSLNVAGTQALGSEIAGAPGADAAAGERWVRVGERLHEGDYAAVVRLLLEQNRQVMRARTGAAPWIEEQEGKLVVRFRDETGGLPAPDDLPVLWRFSYFLDSLRTVALAVKEASS